MDFVGFGEHHYKGGFPDGKKVSRVLEMAVIRVMATRENYCKSSSGNGVYAKDRILATRIF